MNNTQKIIKSAITGILALAVAGTAMAAMGTASTTTTTPNAAANGADMEKCYGIAKAGMNDCSTSDQACAGSATKDKQADAFILLPKGVCARIVGGHTSMPNTATQ